MTIGGKNATPHAAGDRQILCKEAEPRVIPSFRPTMFNLFGPLKTGPVGPISTGYVPNDSTNGAPVTANDLLLGGAYDPSRLHPLADIGDKLDYLLLDDDKIVSTPEESALPSRGWSDDLCYGTGTMYMSGQLIVATLVYMLLIWPQDLASAAYGVYVRAWRNNLPSAMQGYV